MPLLRINHHPSPRQLLVFALAWLVVTGVLGWTQWSEGRAGVAFGCWTLALGVPVVGAVWPGGLRLLYVGLTYVTYPIGFVVSSAVLAMIFYVVLTPIGLILRVCRHDPLQRHPGSRAGSYWRKRPGPPRPASYFRQH